MEEAIKVADPDRWERYILRRHQEEAAAERDNMPGPSSGVEQLGLEDVPNTPQVSEGEDDEAEDLFRDLDEEDRDVRDVGAVVSLGALVAPVSREGVPSLGKPDEGGDERSCEGSS